MRFCDAHGPVKSIPAARVKGPRGLHHRQPGSRALSVQGTTRRNGYLQGFPLAVPARPFKETLQQRENTSGDR